LLSGATAGAILKSVGYFSLFALTIWRHRDNRAVVLGVATVILFCGFLFYVAIVDNQRMPIWAAPTVSNFIVAAGCVVIGIVVADIVRWFKSRNRSGIKANEQGKPGLR